MQIQIGRIKKHTKEGAFFVAWVLCSVRSIWHLWEKSSKVFFWPALRFSLISMQNTIRTIGVFNVNLLGLLIWISKSLSNLERDFFVVCFNTCVKFQMKIFFFTALFMDAQAYFLRICIFYKNIILPRSQRKTLNYETCSQEFLMVSTKRE